MKLQNVPSLRVEDFQSQASWIGRLFVVLNPFIQSINQVLTQNIDFGNNIQAVTQTFTITSFSSFGMKWGFTNSAPLDVRVISAYKGSTQAPTTLLIAWSYNSSTQTITISALNEITGGTVAAPSGTYTFTLRATI